MKRALDLTEAHVVMTQETKKLKEDVPQQQKDAMIAGWRAFCNPGYIKHSAPSAGLATLVRRCFAASLPLGTGDGVVALGRASRVHLDAYVPGGLNLFNVYLFTSEGLSIRNQELLDGIARAVLDIPGQWLIGG